MKLKQIRQAASRSQQDLLLAESKLGTLQRLAKAAKAKSERARLIYKHLRKTAKQCQSLAAEAEELARKRRRLAEKARKRLAKVLKKHARHKPGGKKNSASQSD